MKKEKGNLEPANPVVRAESWACPELVPDRLSAHTGGQTTFKAGDLMFVTCLLCPCSYILFRQLHVNFNDKKFLKNTESQTFGKGTLFVKCIVHPVYNGKGKEIVYPPMFKVFQKLAGQTVFPPYLRSNLIGPTVCPCIELTFVTLLPIGKKVHPPNSELA